MDEIEHKTVATPSLDTSDLREEIESLRHLIGSILILLVVVSGTLTIYLLREMKNTSGQLEAFRPGATNMIAVYQKQQAPAMDDFIKKITQYGQTHKDFEPILFKWGLKTTAPTAPLTGAPPAAAIPAPANTVPKK
jgi:hypothetical protein